MRLRTFTASDMPAALKMVREALGDNAIILNTESLKGQKGITVTAAINSDDIDDMPPAPKAAVPKPETQLETDQLRFEIHKVLRFHNLPEHFIAKLLQKVTPAMLSSIMSLHQVSGHRDDTHLLRQAVEKLAASYFMFSPLLFDRSHFGMMLVGPPGIGKTLTIAKIAALLAMDKQPQQEPWLSVVTTDNKRAGGVEQLQAFTNILGLKLHVAPSAAELSQHLQSLSPRMQVLIDTAGCNPYDRSEMMELKGLAAQNGIEPVLVMQAGGDSLEAIDVVESFMALPIKRLLITRADTARRFGAILSAAVAHNLAFSNVSSSSSIIDTLEAMDGKLLAQMLLRYQLQSR